MHVIKTGALAYLREFGLYGRCDLYKIGNVYLLRITNASLTAERPADGTPFHISVHEVSEWFDRHHRPSSTLIAHQDYCKYHQYDGSPISWRGRADER